MTLFLRFALIGVINTGLHFILLVFMVEKMKSPPPLANAIAFLIANFFSYFANSRFNFRVGISSKRYILFLGTALIGVIIAYGLSAAVERFGGHYLVGFALLIVIMPPVNYLLMRRIAFPEAKAGTET